MSDSTVGAVVIEGLRIRLALVERWRAGRWQVAGGACNGIWRSGSGPIGLLLEPPWTPCGEKSSVAISFSPQGRVGSRRGRGVWRETGRGGDCSGRRV